MIILSQVIIQSTLYIQEYDSHVVNIAGRQRMFSQRINKAALGLYVSTDEQDKARYLNELKTSVELWSQSYNGLQNGDKDLDLPGTNNPKILSLFKEIQPKYEAILNAATNITIIASNNSYDREKLLPDISTIKNTEFQFLNEMDNIVSEYDIEFKQKILQIKVVEIVIMLASFFILGLEILYIFKPALKNVKSAMEEIEGYLNVNIDMLCVIGKDGTFIKVNKAFENVLGYNIDELKGKNIISMVHEGDIPAAIKVIKDLEEQKSVREFLFRCRCADGSYRNLEFGAEPNGKYIYASARDITEKLRMEVELLKNTQNELITRIVENLDVLFIRYTYPEFNFIHMNYKTYSFFKKTNPKIESLSSIIGQNISEFFNSYEKDEIINGIKNSIKQKDNSYFLYKKVIVNKEEKILKCIYQPLFELNNQIAEIIFIAIDVTEEIKAKNEMQETLKVQDEVFANMAHELKTPLNVIFSTNQLMELYLKNNLLEDNREKISQGINVIKQNCCRFIKLINNIVDISKMDSGFFKLNLSNQNIVNVVEEIVQSVSSYIDGKGINIVFDTNTEEKIIACDPEKIERIILNLISNSIKFTNLDGMIFVNVIDKGDIVEILVKDTGIGIDKKYLNNIFERFNQVDKSLSRNAEGSGIGLSLVKSLVELHGGKISVESNLGEGSIFKVELPSITIEEDETAIDKINYIDNKIEMINIEFSDIYSI